mgnify:CR=1 FL=1
MNEFVILCLGIIGSLILALILFLFLYTISNLIFKDEKKASSVSSTDYIVITSLM